MAQPKTLVLFWSATGNTQKVADAIRDGLEQEGLSPVVSKIADAQDHELYDYDLVFIGTPSYQFLPPKPVLAFVDRKMAHHRQCGDIELCAPPKQGKAAVVFCTYSGPHTGIDEATTAGKYLGQFLAHIGFDVVAEWYVVGEYHGSVERSTRGKLGDIRGRPNAHDLADIQAKTRGIINLWRQTWTKQPVA